jgi:hypothetical protein
MKGFMSGIFGGSNAPESTPEKKEDGNTEQE